MTELNIPGNSNPGSIPPSSGTFNFWVVRDDIIRQSMLNLGLLEQSEQPTQQEVIDVSRVLNMILKQLCGMNDKAPGWKMWQRMRGDLFLGASKYVYALGIGGDNWAGGVTGLAYPNLYQQHQLSGNAAAGSQVLTLPDLVALNINDFIGVQVGSDIFWSTVSSLNQSANQVTIATALPAAGAATSAYVWNYTTKAGRPVDIVTALLRDITQTDTPLTIIRNVETYEALPTKVQPGFIADPTAIYYEPRAGQANIGHLYIDCAGAQDVTKRIHSVWLREVMDFNNPGDATDFPQEWFNHLCWTLSLQICGMFDGDWTRDRELAYNQATNLARESSPQVSDQSFMVESEESY